MRAELDDGTIQTLHSQQILERSSVAAKASNQKQKCVSHALKLGHIQGWQQRTQFRDEIVQHVKSQFGCQKISGVELDPELLTIRITKERKKRDRENRE